MSARDELRKRLAALQTSISNNREQLTFMGYSTLASVGIAVVFAIIAALALYYGRKVEYMKDGKPNWPKLIGHSLLIAGGAVGAWWLGKFAYDRFV